MKQIYKIFAAFFTLGLAHQLSAQVPTPDLLHYKFDGGTNTLVTNYASSPPPGTATGTIMGAQTQTGSVICLNALVGSGNSSTSDYINTGWVTNLPGSWSISFWTSNIAPSATLYYIFGDVNAGSFRCFTNGVAGPNNWILRGTNMTDVTLNGAATTTPNLVTFVYDQVASNIVGYINAVPTVTVAQTATPSISGTGPFKIGGYSSNTGLSAGGLMADFRIYSSVLTPTDVLNIYNLNYTPTVSVSGSTLTCSGQTIALSASGATTYTWNTTATTASIVLTPSVNTTYTVTGSYGTCTSTAVQSVSVNATPVINIASSASLICSGQSATLTASGASSYTWNTTSTNTAIAVSPTTTTSYTVTGSTNSCAASSTITQMVSACTAINSRNSSLINSLIYPNPNNGEFTVELANGAVKIIELTDLTGRVIMSTTTSDTKTDFNINSLANGIYFVKVQSNNAIDIVKIVKQ